MAAIGLAAVLALAPLGAAQEFSGALTAPADGDPFGGAAVGSFDIEVVGNTVEIAAGVDVDVPSGYVLEGWLIDTQTGYKLSLGLLDDGDLRFEQLVVNVWTYGILVITLEPAGDLDPNPFMPVAGAPLPAPFGQ